MAERGDDAPKVEPVITVAVVGSREYPWLDLVDVRVKLRADRHGLADLVIRSGHARGVDLRAEQAAHSLGVAVESLPVPDKFWRRYRKMAGHLRNVALVQRADELDAFWTKDSAGTADAVELALARGIPTFVFGPRGERVDPQECVRWLDQYRPRRARPAVRSAA